MDLHIIETYNSVGNLLHTVCHKFRRKYKRFKFSHDDLFSEATLVFLKCYEDWDEDKALFSTWLHYKVWKGLLELLRKPKRVTESLSDVANSPSTFRVLEWMEGLSRETKTVALLVFDTPKQIEQALMRRGRDTPFDMRIAIKSFLRDIDWSSKEILRSFQEIRESLP